MCLRMWVIEHPSQPQDTQEPPTGHTAAQGRCWHIGSEQSVVLTSFTATSSTAIPPSGRCGTGLVDAAPVCGQSSHLKLKHCYIEYRNSYFNCSFCNTLKKTKDLYPHYQGN